MGAADRCREGGEATTLPHTLLVCVPRRANAGHSWRSCFHAVPSPDAPRLVSIPAMDAAWAPRRTACQSASQRGARSRRQGRRRRHPGARPAVAPLRPAVPASAPNPPSPAMALIRVALRGRGRRARLGKAHCGAGPRERRQARDGPFCFQHKPGGAAPRPQNGSGCSPGSDPARTRRPRPAHAVLREGRGRAGDGANGCIGSFVCKCLCILTHSRFPKQWTTSWPSTPD